MNDGYHTVYILQAIRELPTDPDYFSMLTRSFDISTLGLQAQGSIWEAAFETGLEAVKALLADPHFDPSIMANVALRFTGCRNHKSIEIAKLLLADPRVNPSDGNMEFIPCALRDRELTVLCLADKRLDIEQLLDPKSKFYTEVLRRQIGWWTRYELHDFAKIVST